VEGYNNASASGTTKVARELHMTPVVKADGRILHPVQTPMQNLHTKRERRSTCRSTTSNLRPLKTWGKSSPSRIKDVLLMYPRTNSWQQVLHRLIQTSSSGVQLDVKSPDSAIQSLNVLNLNLWVVATTHIGGADSSVGPVGTLRRERGQDLSVGWRVNSIRGIRNVPVYRILQAGVRCTETNNSSIGSILYCHLNSHSNATEGVQPISGMIMLIPDNHLSLILLLVELVVILVNSVLGVPTITQCLQETVQNGREPRRLVRKGQTDDLPSRTHL
jgi:hypothetical protein